MVARRPAPTARLAAEPPVKEAQATSEAAADPAIGETRFTFDSFRVGPANEVAAAAARTVVGAQTPPFNPVFFYGDYGVGKTHLLASSYYQVGQDSNAKRAFATFGELTQLAGVFGFVECIELLSEYVLVCIDEFELDDPGNTTLISRLLSALVERGVSVAATSNTLPEQLGEGRFAAQDFLREIHTLAAMFTTVRIEGPDYRHRDLPPAPQPPSDAEVAGRAAAVPGATLDDFDGLCAHLATMHPSRYLTLIEGVTAVFITGVHPLDDQNVALRLVSLTDRLYDAGIPVVASGAKLDTVFSDEMLAGGFRKKYLRATSRLLALTAAGHAGRTIT